MTPSTNDADVKRLVGQAVAQGFPEKCSDPVTMAKVAAALTGHAAAPAPAQKKQRPKKVA
jgi:hypothetical protein